MEVLNVEHKYILNLLDRIERSGSQNDQVKYFATIDQAIDILRNYADRFHHRKEEQWLFPLLKSKNELLGEGLVHSLLEQHDDLRDALDKIAYTVQQKEFNNCKTFMAEYCSTLRDHIAAEEDELFPMAENMLTENEITNLTGRFEDEDREIGLDTKLKYEKVIDEL